MKKLLYFGCLGGKGHFLYDEFGMTIREETACLKYMPDVNVKILQYLDGTFTPTNLSQGKYNDCVVPPLRIVAWWDYSLDSRGGSNSNLIGYGYESAEEMIDDAYKIFPSVMNRQPRPIKI